MVTKWYSSFWAKKSVASGSDRRSQVLRLEGLEGRVVPSFSSPRTYDAGVTPADVVTGSLRPNGALDLVVSNYDQLNTTGNSNISVYLGNGNGTFRNQTKYTVGVNPAGMALGDLNNDGNPDVLVANSGGTTLSLLLGNGNGTLQRATSITVGSQPTDVVLGDFNEDGNLDAIVSNPGDDDVVYLQGNGDGTFQPPVVIYQNTGSSPGGMAVADFNGDGHLDLAVALYDTNQVVVLQGNGDGTFQPPAVYGTGINPSVIAVADFNGDGAPDMVISDNGDNTVSELLNNNDGSGTFQPYTSITVGTRTEMTGFVAAGDFNQDGAPDIAVTVPNLSFPLETKLYYLLNKNDGSGSFNNPVVTNGGDVPAGVAIGDFNQDGFPDIADTNALTLLINGKVAILTNQANWGPNTAAGGFSLSSSDGTPVDQPVNTAPEQSASTPAAPAQMVTDQSAPVQPAQSGDQGSSEGQLSADHPLPAFFSLFHPSHLQAAGALSTDLNDNGL
jgi:VCBS repeat protein